MGKIAVYPGSFDPVTNGHIDIIKRASRIYDKVIVLVSYNYLKNGGTFTLEQRVDFLNRSLDEENVTVDKHSGLVVNYLRSVGASILIKGLRAMSDFEDEFQQALINKQLAPEIETVFMVSDAKYMYLSSSAVREVCFFGGDISSFVPDSIREDVENKIRKNQH